MVIYIGADHRGFNLKEALKAMLHEAGYDVDDVGAPQLTPDDDYPKYAAAVGSAISKDPGSRGIVICGSGVGVDIVANKFPAVRSVLAISSDQVYEARHDDDANVLALAADFVPEEDARRIVDTFLATPFAEEAKYVRRLREIGEIEQAE